VQPWVHGGGLLGALADMGMPEAGGYLVILKPTEENEQRPVDTLKAHEADIIARHDVIVRSSGLEYDAGNPHKQHAADVGDEGGSTRGAKLFCVRVVMSRRNVRSRGMWARRGSTNVD